MPPHLLCPSCGSHWFTVVKREPVAVGQHFTDYIVTYQCNGCGKPVVVGKKEG